jgi:hypothetical protein
VNRVCRSMRARLAIGTYAKYVDNLRRNTRGCLYIRTLHSCYFPALYKDSLHGLDVFESHGAAGCAVEFTSLTMSDVVEDDVNGRLTGLEASVAHIFVAISEMKADNRDLRGELKDFRNEARGEARDLRNEFTQTKDALNARIDGLAGRIDGLRVEMVMTKVWMLGMLLGVLATLLGVMARGFHWI